jgi:transposase
MCRYYSSDYKRRVVEYYHTHHHHMSLAGVARHFEIKGGHETVSRWVKRGGDQEQRARSGRPRILSKLQGKRYIIDKVKYRNRRNEPIKYNEVRNTIREKTAKSISRPTVRRNGREFGIKQKRTIKRTAVECKT